MQHHNSCMGELLSADSLGKTFWRTTGKQIRISVKHQFRRTMPRTIFLQWKLATSRGFGGCPEATTALGEVVHTKSHLPATPPIPWVQRPRYKTKPGKSPKQTKKPAFHIMASPKCQNSELIRRIPVVALEPQHDEELRHEKHATLKVLLPNSWGCSGLELPVSVSGC